MSKTKKTESPHYELLYIISNKFTEDEISPIIEKVKAILTDNGGTITLAEEWGKKHLAYPISGFSYGYYTLVEFDLLGINLAKIDRSLRMMSEILRHQIVRKDERVETKPAKAAAEASKNAEVEKPVAKEEKVAEAKEDEKGDAKEVAKEKPKAKEKTTMKELDEKLDKILDSSDLL